MDPEPQYIGSQYIQVGVPTDPPSKAPGRVEGILSVLCAVISLIFFFFPIVFGITGIFLGVQSRRKGDKVLGLVGIILSSVFMVAGFLLWVLTEHVDPYILNEFLVSMFT